MLGGRFKLFHIGIGLLVTVFLPVRPAHAQAAPGAGQTVSVEVQLAGPNEHKPVPFELIQNHVFFKARVDGQEVWAMLDNGFHRTAVDLAFARSRNFPVSSPFGRGQTPTGTLELSEAVNIPIEIPGQIKFRPPVVVTDLSFMSRMAGIPVSLVIGADNFAFLSFFISPSQRTFQLTASGAMTPPPQAVALVLRNDRPLIDISIEGKDAVVAVDMGDDVTVALSQAAAERLGLSARASNPGQSSGAEGGTVATRITTVSEIGLGRAVGEQVPVIITPAILPDDGDGRLGMGLLASSNFLIDIKARRIWLLSPVGNSSAEIYAAAQSAARLYNAGATAEAERQFALLSGKVSSAEDLNNLCWAKATARVLLESAIRECTEAVRQSEGNTPLLASHLDSLGMALLQSGKLDEAKTAYSQAIEKSQSASAYMGRALVHRRMGDTSRAEADLLEARRRDPAIEKAYADLGLHVVP